MNRSSPDLANWNPMVEDYENRQFNSYAGRNLYEKISGVDMHQQRNVNPGHELFALHVRRIPLTMSESGLRNLFLKSGDVLDVKVIRNPAIPNPSYHFGKVYFGSSQEAMKGLQALHDTPPLYLKVELDRHSFGQEARLHEAPRYPPQNYAGGSRFSQDERISGGRGLLPTPGQAELASRLAYGNQNRAQGHAVSPNKIRPELKDLFCVKCHSQASKCCTRCKTAYCSQTCQKADWDQHRHICLSIKSDAAGRPYILEDPLLAKQPTTAFSCNSNSTIKSPPRADKAVRSPPRAAVAVRSPPRADVAIRSPQRSDMDNGSDGQTSHSPEKKSEQSQPHQAYAKSSSQPHSAGDKKLQPRPHYGKQNSPKQAAGDAKDQHKPATGYVKSGPLAAGVGVARGKPRPNLGKQNDQRHSGGDTGDHIRPLGDIKKKAVDDVTDGKDSCAEEQKGNYQPLRRPVPPVVSVPKASRLIPAVKLRTMQPVTLGSSTKVKVAHICDPHNFYVQLEKDDDLGEIMRKVQVVDQDPPPKEVAVGQIVAAKFNLDGVWYRARVDKSEKGKLGVNFIDYGNDDVVAMQDLRCLSPEIAELPVQAVWCRLANVQPTTGQWSTDALSCFKVFTENIDLLASLEKTLGGQAFVTLKEDSDGDIGELLMKTELATKSLPVHCSCLMDWHVGTEIILSSPTQEKLGKVWAIHMNGISDDQVAVLFTELGNACAAMDDNLDAAEFVVGTIVAALSPSDGTWYRGIILMVKTNEYLVRYLDFGNCEMVVKLRLLPDAFAQYFTLAICFRVEHPYSSECIPDEFLEDDVLTVQVLRVTGDSATVDVKFGDGSPTIQAIASSIWKYSDGFETPEELLEKAKSQNTTELAQPLAVEPRLAATPTKSGEISCFLTSPKGPERPPSVTHSPSSIIGQGLKLLPKIDVPLHSIAVIPSWIESLDRLSVQFLDEAKMTLLQKLSDDLQEVCQDEMLGSLTKLPAVGQLVCGQFSLDGRWNRCLVEDVHADCRITVRFIDYGNTEVTELECLKPLPNSFYDTCPMALTISIDAVTTLTLEALREALLPPFDEAVPLFMTVVDEMADPIRAVLKTIDGRSLADLLVEYAVCSNAEIANSVNADNLNTAPPVAVIVETNKDHMPQVGGRKEVVHPDVISPAQVKKTNEDIQTVGTVESQVVEATLVDIPPCVQLEVGQCLDLGIGGVHAPDVIMAFKCDPVDVSVYDSLADDITAHCTGKASIMENMFKEGVFCLALSADFGQWFRALVIELVDDNKCRVLFVDYGNFEVVNMSDTRKMTDAFRGIPIQAVTCSIFGVESKEDGYSPEECEAFKDLLTELGIITVDVVQKLANDVYVIRVPSIEADLKRLGFLSD